ncbi:MAG: CIA30 family protein [Acetobacteraceae bacterium]|nr:CIA30 family protein [Acetobacteraceae bacterium]MSP29896.1 CIA30 family protein [Acetobacteraceae bacterium]
MVSYRRTVLFAAAALFTGIAARSEPMTKPTTVIDDLSPETPLATIGTRWQVVTDQVMGGVSRGALSREIVAGRPAMRMRGEVSLENNGGFVQMALDLATDGAAIDASQWLGIELDVFGTGETYSAHLRTVDLTRPWQSYRQGFLAPLNWQTIRLPFSGFSPHRTDISLDLRRLKRLGLVAIGRAFAADLSIGGLRFFA